MSQELEQGVDEFLEALDLPPRVEPDPELVQARGRAVLEAAGEADPEARTAAAGRLVAGLETEDPGAGALVALVLGALVEEGVAPAMVGKPLLARLEQVLGAAAEFRERVDALLPEEEESEELEEEDEDEEDHEHDHDHEHEHEHAHDHGPGCDHDHDEMDEPEDPEWVAACTAAAAQAPGEAAAFESVQQWCLPAIALLTRDPALRAAAQGRRGLLAAAERLADDGAHFLHRLLDAPGELEFLALHPSTEQGFRVRARGVIDNFQLHTLLADALIGKGKLPGRRPPRRQVQVMSGEGPQEDPGATCKGMWNLYTWTALGPDGKLPDEPPNDTWIWGEGTPADISRFEGMPLLLLGPATYERSWAASRTFDALPASVELLEALEPTTVQAWLKRIAARR